MAVLGGALFIVPNPGTEGGAPHVPYGVRVESDTGFRTGLGSVCCTGPCGFHSCRRSLMRSPAPFVVRSRALDMGPRTGPRPIRRTPMSYGIEVNR